METSVVESPVVVASLVAVVVPIVCQEIVIFQTSMVVFPNFTTVAKEKA